MFRKKYIFAKIYGCAKEASFEPKTTISTMNSKSCYNLSFFIFVKLTTIY